MATKGKKKKENLSLADSLGEIRARYGERVVVTDNKELEYIPTGIASLDRVLGGGYPKGRIIEIYGLQSGGKTTTAFQCIAQLQKQGLKSVFIDAEKAFSPDHARLHGVDPDDADTFILISPESGEDALEIAEKLISTGEVAFLVIDSVSALVPEAELQGEMGDASIGMQARLMSQACRKLVNVLEETGTVLFLINQLREKVGVVFGNPEVTSGGKAIPFYASVRMRISISERKPAEGYVKVKLKLDKSKVSAPFQEVEFINYFDKGIVPEESLLDAAVDSGVLRKAGAYIQSLETNSETGKPVNSYVKKEWVTILQENPQMYEELYQKAIVEPLRAEKERIRQLGTQRLLRKEVGSFNPETGEIIE